MSFLLVVNLVSLANLDNDNYKYFILNFTYHSIVTYAVTPITLKLGIK